MFNSQHVSRKFSSLGHVSGQHCIKFSRPIPFLRLAQSDWKAATKDFKIRRLHDAKSFKHIRGFSTQDLKWVSMTLLNWKFPVMSQSYHRQSYQQLSCFIFFVGTKAH